MNDTAKRLVGLLGVPFSGVVQTVRHYNLQEARGDALAGLTVAVVAAPQSMAFALIAGVDPIVGLYGVIVQAAVGCILTSSSHLAIGPTNTISLLVASVTAGTIGGEAAAPVYVALAALSGVMQVAFALARMGALFRYVSHSVIVGFTAGAGVLIIAKQVPDFFGIPLAHVDGHWPGLLGVVRRLWPNITQVDYQVLTVAAVSLAVMLTARKISRILPAPLLAVLSGALLVVLFGWSGDPKEAPVVGELPQSLPPFELPALTIDQVRELAGGALAIALLGMFEAVAIGKSIALRTGERINANQELLAQGTTNFVSSFFGCYPGTGSFSRTALNYTAGGKTRFAGLFNSIFVTAALLLFGTLGKYLPLASLAAILFVVAYGLIDWRYLIRLAHTSRSDTAVCLATFGATLVIPLEYAIFVGIFLNIALYLRRASQLHLAEMVQSPGGPFMERPLRARSGEKDVMFLQAEGDLFFGVADELQDRLTAVASGGVTVVILRLKRTHSIDATVLEVLDKFTEQMHRQGGHVLLCGIREDLYERLEGFGLIDKIGRENVFPTRFGVFASAKAAMERARALVGSSIDVDQDLLAGDETEGWAYQI